MRHKIVFGASLLSLAVAAALPAHAGIVAFSLNAASAPANSTFSWDGNASEALLTTPVSATAPSTIVLNGAVDNIDPIYEQGIIAINNSGVTWYGFQLSVSGKVSGIPSPGIVFVDPASAQALSLNLSTFTYGPPVFPVQTETTPSEITFDGGTLAPGQAIAFLFNVNVPVTNTDFEIDIGQHPIVVPVPEPASMSLLGLGALTLLRTRRRSPRA